MSKINYETVHLKNGVPVLFAQYPDSLTISIGVSFNVGGRNEWKREKAYDGISHFLEHQFFKGRAEDDFGPDVVDMALDELGGMSNAFTTEPVTCYLTKCLKEELFNSIDLWNNLMQFGKISQEEFDKEAFVVKQEFRRFVDNPMFYLIVELGSKLHEGTSLEMTVIGDEESLSTVKLEQMEKYRAEHYDLSNASLLVLGNFDRDETLNKLNDTFGARPVSDSKPQQELTSYVSPTESKMRLFVYDKHSPLSLLGIGIKTPGGRSEDLAALTILKAYLTLGKASLLQEKLIRSGLTAFAFADTNIYEDIGDIKIVLGAPPQMVEQAHTALIQMLYEISKKDVTEEMLSEICDRIEFSKLKSTEEPLAVLFNQSLDYWARGKFLSLEDTMKELRAVTPKQYKIVRDKVFTHLNGAYLMMGTLNDFHPSFPENTFDGVFE